MMTPAYAIGIDLGTTNSSLAYIDLSDGARMEPTLLPLAQWENDDEVIEDLRLPSFLWMLPKSLLKKGLRPHPVFAEHRSPWIVGRYARSKALTEPLQVVHSAKSWASSGTVAQRLSRILPWGSEGDKLSPLEVQTALLDHIKKVWEVRFPAHPFAAQRVVITVPASFDEVAQRLTLEAARGAGFPSGVELLEEPLAAFYDSEARHQAQPGRILVCDIGGGTSDFTLLVKSPESTERTRVSSHLLLGGDNIDLALAHRLSAILSSEELPRHAWNLLLAQVRKLKESALADDAQSTFHLSIPLKANDLFGSYLTAEVASEQIRQWIQGEFFPLVPQDETPVRAAGLQNWGLPYAKDTRITAHLAAFLAGYEIDALLTVGGTMLPQILKTRLLECVQSWQKSPVATLPVDEGDLAIAYGAARFAAKRVRSQELISSPYPRDLLIEVETAGGTEDVKLIPKGHPRMTPYAVKVSGLNLRLGQEVRFQLFALDPAAGKTPLPPLVLKLAKTSDGKDGDHRSGKGKSVEAKTQLELTPVRLLATVRETGVLEVSCHALDSEALWILDFAIETAKAAVTTQSPLAPESVAHLSVARSLIKQHYARQSSGLLKVAQLPLALEEAFKLDRELWSADHLRGLWPALEAVMFQRSITLEHEAIWFYLAGFCLRPGFGYRGDAERMSSILRIYDESFRRVDAHGRLLTHWWILWRRLAGGLNPSVQQKLFDRYIPTLRKDKEASPELIRLLSSLEYLSSLQKEQLGRLLLSQLKEAPASHTETKLWGLARLASRYPVYASAAFVLPPRLVESWADDLNALSLPPKARSGVFYAWAGRLRGDKQYDIDPAYRSLFLNKIDNPEWRTALTEVVAPDFTTQSQMLADSLPSGFVFRN